MRDRRRGRTPPTNCLHASPVRLHDSGTYRGRPASLAPMPRLARGGCCTLLWEPTLQSAFCAPRLLPPSRTHLQFSLVLPSAFYFHRAMPPEVPPLDLQTQAGELARRLGYLKTFLAAAQILLENVRRFRQDVFRMHSKKIITLIEISRATLTRAGIPLYLFTSCAPALKPYKSIYFDLLWALRDSKNIVNDSQIQERVNRLLMPLRPAFVITRNPNTSSSASTSSSTDSAIQPCYSESPIDVRAYPQYYHRARHPSETKTPMAPPPTPPGITQRPSTPPWIPPRGPPSTGARVYARTRSPQRHFTTSPQYDEDEDQCGDQQEDVSAVHAFTAPPSLRRNFGIFCRGVNLGHCRQEHEHGRRNGRARLVRKA
ncbi:hypothetical protein OF83DRAFT_344847 [Amylostereum chailletii]|nr:hypothetical protein OF83DRAFT_344847 [Amylostereum chailletii]